MSAQLDHYLALRARDVTMMTAASEAGLSIEEARLTETAIMRGEVQLPSPTRGEENVAKKAKAGDAPTNLSAAKETIRDVVPRIVNLKAKRKEINADIAELRERVNATGVPKSALDHAIRMKELDPDDRQRFDEGYIIAREAIGLGIQRSLFEMIETPAGQDDDEAPEAPEAPETPPPAARKRAAAPAPDAVH